MNYQVDVRNLSKADLTMLQDFGCIVEAMIFTSEHEIVKDFINHNFGEGRCERVHESTGEVGTS